MTNFKTLAVVTAAMLTLSGAAHSAGHSQTIVDIAAANERFFNTCSSCHSCRIDRNVIQRRSIHSFRSTQ